MELLIKITETTETTNQLCCTWQDETICENCQNNSKLDCRWERRHVIRFLLTMSPALLVTFGAIIVGSIFTGRFWWILGVLVGYYAIFFVIETRILCSHCPYYSKEGIMLHCLANHGFIRFYKYHPEPMNKFEKTLLVIGFVLFGTLPLAGQIPSILVLNSALHVNQGQFITLLVLMGISIISVIFSFTYLFTKICTKCINFSCPFNSVNQELVEDYLERNPYMKNAWEKEKMKK